MDLIFGSPLGKLKTELQVHRIKGDWEVILHKLQIFEGNRDASLLFYEGESKVELHCEEILARQYNQRDAENQALLASPDPIDSDKTAIHSTFERIESDSDTVADDSKTDGVKTIQIFLAEKASEQEESLKHVSWIILAKQAYLAGNLENAAVFLHNAQLHKFQFAKQNDPRTLRLVAEGLAINGQCAEKFDLPNTPVRSDEERATFTWTCYEIAAALALRCNNATPSDILTTQTAFEAHALFLGPILEKAIRTCLLVGPQDENIQHSLQKYRWCLQTMRLVSSRLLRLQFTRQMVEILAGGVESTKEHRDKLVEKLDNLKVPFPHLDTPAPEKTSPPENSDDEQMLLLEVANNLAAEEMVLNMSNDFTSLRSTALGLALPILDLAAIRALRMNQSDMLESNWSKIIPRCYDLPFMILRYAQAQACNSRYQLAYGTLQNLFRVDKQNQRGHVLAAVLCLQHLNEPFLGAKHAQNALDATHEENERYIPLLLLAVALAQQLNLPTVRRTDENMEKVAKMFEEAIRLNQDDYRLFLNKALFEAQCGWLDEASSSIQQCLMINEDCGDAWHLCALILTAVGRTDEALELLEQFVEEETADMDIFGSHLALLEKMGRWKDALSLAKIVLCKVPVPHVRLLEEDQEIDFLDGPSHVSLSSLPSADRKGEGDYESETLRISSVTKTDEGAVEVLSETVSTSVMAMDTGDNEQLGEAVTTSTVIDNVLQYVTTSLGLSSTASSNEVNQAMIVEDKLTVEADIHPEPDTVPSTGIFYSMMEKVTSVFTSTTVEQKAEVEDFKKAVEQWWTPGAVEKQRSLLLAHIACLLINMGSFSEAEDAVTQADSLHVDTYLLEHVKGLLSVANGHNVQAKACFELAVLLNPSFVSAWLGLLDVAVQDANSGLISEYLIQMRQHCVDDVETWMLSGQFAMEMDKEEEADGYLERAHRLMENRPVRTFRVINWKVSL